ncbi:MAG: aldo/keto reductase [Candidatus Omnitrophota bacterium]|nr:MAG: aldo/keto reductase [Candidatus Omnitrophota bacterium]
MNTPITRRTFLASTAAGVSLPVLANPAAVDSQSADIAMPLRPLGKTGRMISIVGFGGGSRYLLQDDPELAETMIHRAIELGVNYFDTAHSYTKAGKRESQQRYGRYLIPHYRDRITLSTKLNARDAETAKRQFEESLNDLQTDHVDILHLHGLATADDIDRILAENGALKAYRKWKEEGVIGAIGITGHGDSNVIADGLQRIQPDVVMCPQNPAHDGNYVGLNFAEDVIPYALEHGIGLLAMKTTAQNALIGKGGVAAEELIRYALNLPVAAAVIGMPTLEIVESNAAIARTLKPLSDEEKKQIRKKLAYAAVDGTLPYLAAGYVDGHLACMVNYHVS